LGARRKTIPIRNFGFGRANNVSWGLGVPHHHASPSGLALAGTRNLVPLRRQLSTAVTCWVVPNLSALVGQPTLNVGIDSDSGRSSNRTGGYCSRRTNAVKFRRVEPNLSAHLRACPLVRVQPSGRTRQVAHTWTGRWPFCHGVAAHLSCPPVSAVSILGVSLR
jgi:hypothetical protein